MNGKGSSPRPLSVPSDTFAARWQRTFQPRRNRVCERCGKPNREVEIGFVLCPPCHDLEVKEAGERGGWEAIPA